MNKCFLVTFFIITLLLFPKPAFASCMVKSTVEVEAKNVNLIFIGTVTKITPAQIAGAGYPLNGKKVKWEKYFQKTDLVKFTVSEVFKGAVDENIEIATSANGDAGYKFESGTWLKEGQTYLIYAYKRQLAGTVDDDLNEENYGDVVAELRKIQAEFPKALAAEINEFNSKISPYGAGVCGRTININYATEEIEQIREMFPESKRVVSQQVTESDTSTFFQRFLSFFGFA